MAEKQTLKERRAAHEYTKSLNKPGRVGTFAEAERDRRTDERIERESRKPRTERQDVKLPGSALLITIGLFVLWIAATGKLDRIGKAWDFIREKTDKLPGSQPNTSSNPNTGLMHFDNYHVETHLAQPVISATQPGGIN